MEQQALNEALALYQASVRRSPALMMETVNVDSNRGVTARGNSPYDKFASPATRAKVLESRMQEIAAFAQSRSIPTSNLYALAEAAMRTGKIPDMGQFGLAGDDAVATKQFLISNVLNIAGLEWTDYKGDPVVEADTREAEAEQAERRARQEKLAARRSAARTTGGQELAMSDVGFDPARFMAESVKGKPQHGRTPEQVRRFTGKERGQSDMKRAAKASDETRDIAKAQQVNRDRKPIMPPAEPKMTGGAEDVVASAVGFDPSRYMAEEGGPYRTGGAPESANSSPAKTSSTGEVPHNLQHYEKKDLLPKKVMDQLRKQVGDGVYGYTREDLFRLARERGLLGTEESVEENAGHLGAAGNARSAGSQGLGSYPGPTKSPYEDEEMEKAKRAVKEDRRSESDKILGIVQGDPRGEAWPKLGSSMAALLNLESQGVFRGPRGFHMEEPTEAEPIQEMTTAGGMGAFLGAGMVGSGLTGRTCAMPSYDASYELPEDPEKRIEALKKMLSKHGLKKPVEETEWPQAPTPRPQPTQVSRPRPQQGAPGRPARQKQVGPPPGRKETKPEFWAKKPSDDQVRQRYGIVKSKPPEPDYTVQSWVDVDPSQQVYEAAPNSTEVPVVRDEAYDRHPSRFMKRR